MWPSMYSIIWGAIGLFFAGMGFGYSFCLIYLHKNGFLK